MTMLGSGDEMETTRVSSLGLGRSHMGYVGICRLLAVLLWGRR